MLLTHTGPNGRFELRCSYEESVLAQYHGFAWDGNKSLWWTGQGAVAKRFLSYADASALAILENHAQQVEDSSAATDDNKYEIAVPAGLEYLPFQRAGILWMVRKLGFNPDEITEEYSAQWGVRTKTE